MKIYETKNEYGSTVRFECDDQFNTVKIYINDVLWGTTKEEPYLKLLLRDIHSKHKLYNKKSLIDEIGEILNSNDHSNLISYK